MGVRLGYRRMRVPAQGRRHELCSMTPVSGHDIIVIGASAGGLEALKQLVAGLPSALPAACFAVLHMPRHWNSSVPEILSAVHALPVRFAEDGAPIRPGALMIARADRHLIVRRDDVRLSGGPHENFWRPAIDVLFRSAAVAHRSRVVGVVLSGTMDDGVAGLAAIRACGGEALVQSPEEAAFADLPEHALRQVEGARAMNIGQIAAELRRLAHTAPLDSPAVPPELALEARITEDGSNLAASLAMPDELSLFTCPECGGPLAEQHDQPLRFRCVVGHGFSARSLDEGMRRQIESSLWAAIRLLQQRSLLSRTLGEKERDKGRRFGASSYLDRANEDAAHADVLRRLLMQIDDVERSAGDDSESGERLSLTGSRPAPRGAAR
jgi:two-component system, chemotaxis family, protein-glutamate methylesterase/glutaminase